jgi:hypothetical protein
MCALLFLLLQNDDRPVVSLRLENEPIRRGFEEIARQSGLEFQVDPKIADDRVTLALDRAGAFEAAHALCQAHKGARILFSTFSRRIQIAAGSAARPPTCDAGAFHHVLSGLTLSRQQSFDQRPQRRATLTIWTAWTPAAPPASLAQDLVVTEAADDTGRSLVLPDGLAPRFSRVLGRPVAAEAATVQLDHPAPEAKRLRLKGYREAVFIGEKRPIRIEGFEKLPSASAKGEITLMKYHRGKSGINAVFEGPRPGGEFALAEHLPGLAFVDSKGQRYPARVTTATAGPDRASFEVVCTDVPEDAGIVACEADYVVQWMKKRIPFEFANVELP